MNQILSDQIIASLIQEGINRRELEMIERLAEIQQVANEKMQYARTALMESLKCVENVRDFTSNPEHILGTMWEELRQKIIS